jgi:hypothetical protein
MSGAAVRADSMIPNFEVVSILTAEYLTPAEVAAVLKVSRKALADMRLKQSGPPFILRARGVVAYPAESFRRWLRAQVQSDCREKVGPREARWSRRVTGIVTPRQDLWPMAEL